MEDVGVEWTQGDVNEYCWTYMCIAISDESCRSQCTSGPCCLLLVGGSVKPGLRHRLKVEVNPPPRPAQVEVSHPARRYFPRQVMQSLLGVYIYILIL